MSKTLSNEELGVLKMAARHSVDGTYTLDAALLVALCDEILEYRKAAASNVESEKPEVVEEPFVGPTGGPISLEQLEKARKDYAAGKPTGESGRDEPIFCPNCGVKMHLARGPIGLGRFVCGCGVAGPTADSPDKAKAAMESFVGKTISKSLEIADVKIQGEIAYLQDKLKQAENDRDFALDALEGIAKGIGRCAPYPAATKRIVLAEYERLKKATQIPCGMGEVRND